MAALSGALVLSACTEPGQMGQNSNNPNTQQGALIGAGAGAAVRARLVSKETATVATAP